MNAHRKRIPEHCLIKQQNVNRKHTCTIDLETNRIPFGAKPTGKVRLKFKSSSISQYSETDFPTCRMLNFELKKQTSEIYYTHKNRFLSLVGSNRK